MKTFEKEIIKKIFLEVYHRIPNNSEYKIYLKYLRSNNKKNLKREILKIKNLNFDKNVLIKKFKNLEILLPVKNNEFYLKKFFPKIRNILENNFNITWFIYENGSIDNTKSILNFYFNNNDRNLNYISKYHKLNCHNKNNKNKIILEDEEISYDLFNDDNVKHIIEFDCLKKEKESKIGFRCEKLAIVREELKKLIFNDNDNDYCILLDTDIVFDIKNSIIPLLDAAEKNKDGVMFCTFGVTPYKKDLGYYYDTFALNYGDNIWDSRINEILNNKFKKSNHLEILTGFGGLVLIKKDVLKKCKWSTVNETCKKYNGYKKYGISEHYSFCDDVRKYGKIYLVKNSISVWLKDENYINTNNFIPNVDKDIKSCIKKYKILKNQIDYETL